MKRPIGFFDSGVGGLSVMKYAISQMPNEDYIYYGDNKNAPYGVRTREEILRLTRAGVDELIKRGIKALVIACNTATSAAAAELRAELAIPVVAMEPPLKPAHESRRDGQVIVIATSATLRQEKFADLYARYGEGAVCVPGTGIVELIESGILAGPEMHGRLVAALGEALKTKTDAIALGCTHYNFIKEAIRAVVGPSVAIVDSVGGTVRQLYRVLCQNGLLDEGRNAGGVTLLSSGGDASLSLMRRLLDAPLA